MAIRDKPSSKAREKSYVALRQLFNLLDKLMISHPLFNDDNYSLKEYLQGWKEWVIKHTPPDKRGGNGKN